MTEKTPPEGKTWLTVELDSQQVTDLADVDIWDLDVINEVAGPEPEEDPSDKCNRLLADAEQKFRDAGEGFRPHNKIGTGIPELMEGTRYLAEALKVFREEL